MKIEKVSFIVFINRIPINEFVPTYAYIDAIVVVSCSKSPPNITSLYVITF